MWLPGEGERTKKQEEEKWGYEHVLLIIKLKVCIFIVYTIFIILNKYYFKLINKKQTKNEVCT